MRWVHCCVVSISVAIMFSLLSPTASADLRVWTGLTMSFTKAPGVNPSTPGNYDAITETVALSRLRGRAL